MTGGFKHALKEAKKIEKKIGDYFTSKGYEVLSISSDNTCDLIIKKGDKKKLYEVKTDYIIREDFDTGNMFIECECRNKPSGIATSKSNWYIYYFINLNEMWFIKTSDLKFLIIQNDFELKKQVGDEGSNTQGYLIPRFRKDIKKLFTIKKLC
jgi:hypothetical protein